MGNPPAPLSDTIVTRMIRTAYPDAVSFDIKRLGINAGGLLVGAIETTGRFRCTAPMLPKYLASP